MKKKILLVMTSMSTGGIATAICNFIKALPQNEFDIELLLFNDNFKENLSPHITVSNAGGYMRQVAISQRQAFNENFWKGCYRLLQGGITKVFGHGLAYRNLLRHTKQVTKEYDYAISCSQSGPDHSLYGGCNEFVLSKVMAKMKIAFIHCDYKLYGINSKYSHKIYKQFDKIACVSESVKAGFLQCEPEFQEKVCVSTNFHDFERINEMSLNSPEQYSKDVFNIVTVARLGKEKGHVRMVPIFRELYSLGYKFMWHIVGGSESDAPKELMVELEAFDWKKCITMHGNQSNPYKYMRNAQLLLIPSYHEAAPMVYTEAGFLGIPILTTNTLSARELVEKTGIGMVCGNSDAEIKKAIRLIMDNPIILDRYRHNSEEYSNEKAILQFRQLISIGEAHDNN